MYLTSCFTAPSSPPLNVTIVAINATTISVSWETPPVIHHNGDLTGFRVLYRNTALGSSAKELEVSSPEQLSIAVTRLTPYTSYSVKVAVVNTVDTGPYSKDVTVQTSKSGKRTNRLICVHCTVCMYMCIWHLSLQHEDGGIRKFCYMPFLH